MQPKAKIEHLKVSPRWRGKQGQRDEATGETYSGRCGLIRVRADVSVAGGPDATREELLAAVAREIADHIAPQEVAAPAAAPVGPPADPENNDDITITFDTIEE